MTREIKVRCWDGIGNHGMQYFESLQEIADYYRGHKYQAEMLCTGLKDKNGKEIWEGDIVKFTDFTALLDSPHPFTVEWDPAGYWNIAGYDFELEVIGNIYENGDLLEKN